MLKADPHCAYCGRGLGRQNATLDHVTPKSKGGRLTKDNRVLSCDSCNRRKADMTPERWVATEALEVARLARRCLIVRLPRFKRRIVKYGVSLSPLPVSLLLLIL